MRRSFRLEKEELVLNKILSHIVSEKKTRIAFAFAFAFSIRVEHSRSRCVDITSLERRRRQQQEGREGEAAGGPQARRPRVHHRLGRPTPGPKHVVHFSDQLKRFCRDESAGFSSDNAPQKVLRLS